MGFKTTNKLLKQQIIHLFSDKHADQILTDVEKDAICSYLSKYVKPFSSKQIGFDNLSTKNPLIPSKISELLIKDSEVLTIKSDTRQIGDEEDSSFLEKMSETEEYFSEEKPLNIRLKKQATREVSRSASNLQLTTQKGFIEKAHLQIQYQKNKTNKAEDIEFLRKNHISEEEEHEDHQHHKANQNVENKEDHNPNNTNKNNKNYDNNNNNEDIVVEIKDNLKEDSSEYGQKLYEEKKSKS
jgi:hypothetical protein